MAERHRGLHVESGSVAYIDREAYGDVGRMSIAPYRLDGFGIKFFVLSISAIALAACSAPAAKVSSGKSRSKEYFAESEYGVKASPRVTNQRTRLPRGGGRDQVGKPYKVKGQWYRPKEEPGYRKTGMASWYGDAFHGRLTANGEIYDMTHLTAAHPTMPLPSYARVTNTKNGSSIIVRVNDRGPYAHGRVIDLSRRAAELLDYTQAGTAKVNVEYVGRAPLHGNDDQYLMASYRPSGGGRAPSPIDDGLPTGVMIAMNGPTPTQGTGIAASVPFPSQSGMPASTQPTSQLASLDFILPEFGPFIPEKPGTSLAFHAGNSAMPAYSLAYADQRVKHAALAVNALAATGNSADELVAALNNRYSPAANDALNASSDNYIAVGTYPDQQSAEIMAARLSTKGRVAIETDWNGDGYTLSLRSDGRHSLDNLLQAAWAAGASDAMPIH